MRVFPAKIKTKRKKQMCDILTNNKEYTLVSSFLNPLTESGFSFVVIADNDLEAVCDCEFFRLNSIKINKIWKL